MRLPGTHVDSHLEKDEGGLVKLFMEIDPIDFVNLVLFLLLLGIFVLLFHLLRQRSRAKAAAVMGTNCRQQTQRKILLLAKRVKVPGFDFSVRQSCFPSLKQQIQRKTSLGPNSQIKGLFSFPKQDREIPSASAICLRLPGNRPISCLMPARKKKTRLLPLKGFSLAQSSSRSHVLPTLRANPISDPSKSFDNLVHNFCPLDSRAKLKMVANSKSVPNVYSSKSTIFAKSPRWQSKSSLGWVKRQTEVQAKSLPNLYKKCQPGQAAAKKNQLTYPLLMHTFSRGPHVKRSYLSAKKSPTHGKSSVTSCLYHQLSTTTANSKSLFCLEKFQS